MRILMIWSENLNKPGSGRTHFVHLARGLAACGNQVRIVAPGYPPRTTADLGVPVSYVPTLRRNIPAFLVFHALLLPAVPYLLLRYRPDAVYTRGLFHSFLIHGICWLLRIRYVAEINSIVDLELAMRGFSRFVVRLVRFLDRWNLRRASAFVCVTEKLRAELIRRGAKADRVFAVHNGAATDLFKPGDRAAARRNLGLPGDGVLLGFVGTLSAWQGLDLLVFAAARINEDGQPCQVIIVGDGEERAALANQIRRCGLRDFVHLLPAVPHQETLAYLQALDMAIIPIYDDRKLRYGLSALKFWEALAVGLPTLVPDMAALGDVLAELRWPGEFATGDVEALAQSIRKVAAKLPELRGRRREIHEAIRRDHSWHAVAARIEHIFSSLKK